MDCIEVFQIEVESREGFLFCLAGLTYLIMNRKGKRRIK